jgi:hypothetical protein
MASIFGEKIFQDIFFTQRFKNNSDDRSSFDPENEE